MNTLSYKGFLGTLEVSKEDKCLYGKILGLPAKTLILYEGETYSELEEDFHNAVDDYISRCKAKGINPHKSYSGALNIRISPTMHRLIAETAIEEGISINAVINETLGERFAVNGR